MYNLTHETLFLLTAICLVWRYKTSNDFFMSFLTFWFSHHFKIVYHIPNKTEKKYFNLKKIPKKTFRNKNYEYNIVHYLKWSVQINAIMMMFKNEIQKCHN